jgi:hypothetical protein
MSDVVVFVGVLVSLFVAKAVVATAILLWVLPGGDRCPNCDAESIRVQSAGLNRLLPWFRSSWCFECGWEGMLRSTRSIPPLTPRSRAPGAVPHRQE